jgi:hypothetical protein
MNTHTRLLSLPSFNTSCVIAMYAKTAKPIANAVKVIGL